MKLRTLAGTACCCLLALTAGHAGGVAAAEIAGTPVWTTTTAAPGGAEIAAHDPKRQLVYVVGGTRLDVLRAADGTRVRSFDLDPAEYEAVNSVAVSGDVLAIAAAAVPNTEPGKVFFLRAGSLDRLGEVTVGALPDMIVFTGDGKRLLVANEGQPSDDYTIDPEGSVSVIDVATRRERRATFAAFNDKKANLIKRGVRIFGPGASVAQDLEPEYIAVSDDGKRAWVTLQENNALAVVDLDRPAPKVVELRPLGSKNLSKYVYSLDVSDEDGKAGDLRSYEHLFGLNQPDGIAFARLGGVPYLLTANEGDARDYEGFSEETRVGDLTLRPGFPEADALARLRVTNTLGTDPRGRYRDLFAFGGRSFSIWTLDGTLAFDSGRNLELTLSRRYPALFDDGRSDDKGPEPEGIVVGEVGGRQFAFVGLERARSSAVAVYDVTERGSTTYGDFSGLLVNDGDLAPEGLDFVPAAESPTGKALLIVANEVSSTTTAFELVLE